jgi:hypothetical protein
MARITFNQEDILRSKLVAPGPYDILVKKYNIKYGKNKLHSGCIGWGYERFIYAIISQGKNLNY